MRTRLRIQIAALFWWKVMAFIHMIFTVFFLCNRHPSLLFLPNMQILSLSHTWQLCIWFFSLYANNIFVRQAAFMLCHIISWILCWHAFVRMNINFSYKFLEMCVWFLSFVNTFHKCEKYLNCDSQVLLKRIIGRIDSQNPSGNFPFIERACFTMIFCGCVWMYL